MTILELLKLLWLTWRYPKANFFFLQEVGFFDISQIKSVKRTGSRKAEVLFNSGEKLDISVSSEEIFLYAKDVLETSDASTINRLHWEARQNFPDWLQYFAKSNPPIANHCYTVADFFNHEKKGVVRWPYSR